LQDFGSFHLFKRSNMLEKSQLQCNLLVKNPGCSFEPLTVRLDKKTLKSLEIRCRNASIAFLKANNCNTNFGKFSIKSPFKKSSDPSLPQDRLKKEQQIFTTKPGRLTYA
jgi:hypothetical protein